MRAQIGKADYALAHFSSLKTRKVRLGGVWHLLTPVTPLDFGRLPVQQGFPSIYTVKNNAVYFWPTPDAPYELE